MTPPAPGVKPITVPGQRHLEHQIVQFSRALHEAGLPVSPASLIVLGDCLRHIDIRDRTDFHAAARAALVTGQADLPVFERVFEEFWNGPDRPRHPSSTRRETEAKDEAEDRRDQPVLQQWEQSGQNEPADGEAGDDPLAWSRSPALVRKDFGHMTDSEIEEARRLLATLVALLAHSPSRRLAPSPTRGVLDLRRMLRANALSGTDGMALRYRRRRMRRTRLLLLCDVSGSMERYSQFLIAFTYALRQQLARIDVAVFATRMTVITHLLEQRDIERVLNEIGAEVRDWGGGTDIGTCLRSFNDRYASVMHRAQTTAIVLSDGWDRGDAQRMRDEIQRLNRSVRRLIWLNPLLGHDAYQPLCRGMRTALPFIDDFLPAHNLESLAALLRQLRGGHVFASPAEH